MILRSELLLEDQSHLLKHRNFFEILIVGLEVGLELAHLLFGLTSAELEHDEIDNLRLHVHEKRLDLSLVVFTLQDLALGIILDFVLGVEAEFVEQGAKILR